MAKIDLEKLICSLAKRKYFSEEKLQGALKEQGLEYKDGEIVESQKPKFKVGDTMRTLQEANGGYTDGMPVVVSIDNEYYHCTNELIAIKDQDDYEFPPINVKQNTADYVGPKFHKGDWVTDGYLHCKISDVLDDRYIVDTKFAKRSAITFKRENNYHLWSIQDAKDGDVLTCGDDKRPFIFKGLLDPNHPNCPVAYCGIDSDGLFFVSTGDHWWTDENVCPATNAQRDTLFTKMKEAGYEWDNEKKELKKVDRTKDLSNYIKFLKSFHCWNKIQREIMDKYLEEQIKKNYSPEKDEELFFGDFRKTDSEDKGKASFANRQVYNRAILKLLSDYVEKYPDVRFVEMLCNLGFYLDYMEESQITYLDLNKIINKQK